MGALPKLKVKVELNYRKGPTRGGCDHCNHLRKLETEKGPEFRCTEIGLSLSRRYRIRVGMICDREDNSKYMARLKG
jgi:hypothetical protein